MMKIGMAAVAVSLLVGSAAASAGPEVFEDSAGNAADLEHIVDKYRDFLGTLNPNVVGSFADGRREINWDGVGDADADPNVFPPNFFNDPVGGSPRGVVLFTPGSGLVVSANAHNPTHTEIEFGDLNRAGPRNFDTFSPQRLFSSIDDTVVEILFFEPGTPNAATVTGFGAVFTDVDRAGVTKIEYLDINGNLLFSRTVLPGPVGRESLSFLGVAFVQGEEVYMVRITSGNRALTGGNRLLDKILKTNDVVVMDDFIYAEPQPVRD